MKLLLDTNALLWAGLDLLDAQADDLLMDHTSENYFSTVSLWEMVIKNGRNRPDFHVNVADFRRQILNAGFIELDIGIEHILAVGTLPALHRDPFDRLLIAQANIEHMTLLTADKHMAEYPGDIQIIPKPKPDRNRE